MKLLVTIIVSLTAFSSYCQKMDSDYFEEGVDFYQAENFEKAAECFQYISENYTKSSYYELAIYNLALSYMAGNNSAEAIKIFRFILNSEADDSEYVGGNIMSNPFANYKHNSASHISAIYKNLGEYDSALVYFSYADTLYRLQSTCGNEIQDHVAHKSLYYADLYHKLGKKPEAIRSLLRGVWFMYSENQQIIDSLQTLLADENDVLKEFDRAIKKLKIKKKKNYCSAVIEFRGKHLVVPSAIELGDPCNRKETIEAVKKSKLYKMISEL